MTPVTHSSASVAQLSAKLAEEARLLATPADYFHGGVGHYTQLLPGRILFFCRRRADELLRRAGPYHHHHRWVLVVSLKGSGRVYFDANQTLLKPGMAALINPYQYHTFSHTDEEIVWLFLCFDRVAEPHGPVGQKAQKLDAFEFEMLIECLRCWVTKGSEYFCPLYVSLIFERLKAREDSRTEEPEVSADVSLLVRINELTFNRPDRLYTLKEMAAELRMSESHLRARFRSATGESLGKHLRGVRLHQACQLLHSSALSITQVAEECGFNNVFAFSRAFRSAFHQSPSEYRQMCKNGGALSVG